jgi:hypothetical protein
MGEGLGMRLVGIIPGRRVTADNEHGLDAEIPIAVQHFAQLIWRETDAGDIGYHLEAEFVL